MNHLSQINDIVSASAIIIRRYALGGEQFVWSTFSKLGGTDIHSACKNAALKVTNDEVVKDAADLSQAESAIASEKMNALRLSDEEIKFYLQSKFDPRALKLRDENIERRYRHLLAQEYISRQIKILNAINATNAKSARRKRRLRKIVLYPFVVLLILFFFFGREIIDGLTPVGALTDRIYEKSKRKFSGAICNDGWTSRSQGSGTCSHHGGVDYYFYKGDYGKTLDECRAEAFEKSWIGE